MSFKHTLTSVTKEARKYNTRTEFRTQSSGSYYYAKRHKLLDKICNHMVSGFLNMGQIWTFESCKKEAKKYQNRTSFKLKKGGAYKSAQINGWLNKICSHMIPNPNLREKKLQNKIYKKLKRQYRDLDIKMEVKIPKRDNLAGRIDFTIKNPTNGKFIGLELKHSESYWSQKGCKTQISKYNRAFRERKGFKGVYLVSDNGSIGKSIDIIPKLIKKIL
jgi:hypothetical protein